MIREKIYQILLYLTNNEKKPAKEWRRDETVFDIMFFIALVISIILGLGCWIGAAICKFKGLLEHNAVLSEIGGILTEGGWIFVGIFWFIEAWDSIRHNREED